MLFLATFSINHIFSRNPHTAQIFIAGRPWTWRPDLQNRVITGTFSRSSGLLNTILYFPKNHTTPPQKVLYPGASYFSLFCFQNPFHECLFILLFFSAQIFHQGRISPTAVEMRFSGDSSLYFLSSLLEL